MIERKKPEADLKNYYTVFLQVGLLLTLLICIGVVKLDWVTEAPEVIVLDEQEIVEMEEIIQTRQIETPPPPPRQPVPVEVPNDQIIEDVTIDIGEDRKSTRLNSSHVAISYAVFCLNKKTIT